MELTWFKSSYSANDENCVELAWMKSSYSTAQENCVEVAFREPAVLIRDSKDPDGGVLKLSGATFLALTREYRAGF